MCPVAGAILRVELKIWQNCLLRKLCVFKEQLKQYFDVVRYQNGRNISVKDLTTRFLKLELIFMQTRRKI